MRRLAQRLSDLDRRVLEPYEARHKSAHVVNLPLGERERLGRLWRAAFLALLAILGLVATWPLFSGHRPHVHAGVAPFLALLFAAYCAPWALLPVVMWPRSLSDLDKAEPVFITLWGQVRLHLDRLASADCRTIWSRAGSVTYLSLRDADGARVVVMWERLVGTPVEEPLRSALTRPDVIVTPRARQAMGLLPRPSLALRASLCLRSTLLFGAVTLAVVVAGLRTYVGIWWFLG